MPCIAAARSIRSVRRTGPPKGRFVRRRVGHIQPGAVDPHQAQSAQGAARELVVGKRSNDAVKEVSQWRNAESSPRQAQRAACGQGVAGLESPGVLIDAADGEVGEKGHRQDDPERDRVRQHAGAGINPLGCDQGVLDDRGRNEMGESGQAVGGVGRRLGRHRGVGGVRTVHGLLRAANEFVQRKRHAIQSIRLIKRYWGSASGALPTTNANSPAIQTALAVFTSPAMGQVTPPGFPRPTRDSGRGRT